jgi:MerR family transcriptional regulator, light-induced transcriptional regulator
MAQDAAPTLTIGALSQATGVPVETIRTWERRYALLEPERDAAGHRIYSASAVALLRLFVRARQQGHRPSRLAQYSTDELRELVGVGAGLRAGEGESQVWLDSWMQAVAQLDRRAFQAQVNSAWAELSVFEFVDGRLHPFLVALGQAWATGGVGVRHEHFAAECIRHILSTHWGRLNTSADGPKVVFASLPDEHHCLALHMAALMAALASCRVVFLGADTPIDEIVGAAEQDGAIAVLTSMAACDQPEARCASLHMLRDQLDSQIDLIYGGAGAPPTGPAGTRYMNQMGELYGWLAECCAIEDRPRVGSR